MAQEKCVLFKTLINTWWELHGLNVTLWLFFLYTKMDKFCFELLRLMLEIIVTFQKFNTAE